MNFKEILELIDKVAEHGIGGIEIEQAGTKVRIEGKPAAPQHVITSYMSDAHPDQSMFRPMQSGAIPAVATTSQSEPKAIAAPVEDTAGQHIMTSPIVGTFYRSPNPEALPFVNVGDRVSKGQVICIIEAMKLMNEIESDVDGVITKIYPQNGQPIEYGENLFAIKN